MPKENKYDKWVEWDDENSKGYTFGDMLLPDWAVANIFNQGLTSNPATAKAYVELMLDFMSLKNGLGNEFSITFENIKELSDRDWENEVAIKEKFVEHLVENTSIDEMRKVLEAKKAGEKEKGEDNGKDKPEIRADI